MGSPDLTPHNILLGVRDPAVWEPFEDYEENDPAPRKILIDRTIYMSVNMPMTHGSAVISDFGEARLASEARQEDLIMPSVYRAPECVLGMPWSYPVDIWALGMTVSPSKIACSLADGISGSILTLLNSCGIPFRVGHCLIRLMPRASTRTSTTLRRW